MRNVILYIAISLDGKIADAEGQVDWLNEMPNPDNSDYGYKKFFDGIDTVLMGNTTYQQVLGFGQGNPYAGKNTFVFTRQKQLKKDKYVVYISGDVTGFIGKLKKQEGKDIWCVGGGEINTSLLAHGLIDEIRVFIMPILLGDGLSIVKPLPRNVHLDLLDSKTYASGVTELKYTIKAHNTDQGS
jgi:dihydrofolate reductase